MLKQLTALSPGSEVLHPHGLTRSRFALIFESFRFAFHGINFCGRYGLAIKGASFLTYEPGLYGNQAVWGFFIPRFASYSNLLELACWNWEVIVKTWYFFYVDTLVTESIAGEKLALFSAGFTHDLDPSQLLWVLLCWIYWNVSYNKGYIFAAV